MSFFPLDLKQAVEEVDAMLLLVVSGYFRTHFKKTIALPIIHICLIYAFRHSIDTEILTPDECQILINIVSETLLKSYDYEGCLHIDWKLLFRASRDTYSAVKWHEMCDNHENILCICETEKNSNVLGGFTAKGWESGIETGSYVEDHHAFLYILRSNRNYQPQVFQFRSFECEKQAVFHYNIAGNRWLWLMGKSGTDLFVQETNDTKNMFNHVSDNTGVDNNSFEIPSAGYLNGGPEFFQLRKFETFQLHWVVTVNK